MKAQLCALLMITAVPLAAPQSTTQAICEMNVAKWFTPGAASTANMNSATIQNKALTHCQLTRPSAVSGYCQGYVDTLSAVLVRDGATASTLYTVSEFCATVLPCPLMNHCESLDTELFDDTN